MGVTSQLKEKPNQISGRNEKRRKKRKISSWKVAVFSCRVKGGLSASARWKVSGTFNYLFFSFFSFSHSYHLFDLAFPSAGLWHPFKTRDSSAMFPLLPFPVTKQKTNQMLLWNSSLRKKKYIVFIINLCSKDCSMLSANIYQQCLYLNSQGINFCKASHV